MLRVPYIAWASRGDIELATAVGQALDELVAFAREHGCSEEELEERLDEALGRYEESL